MPMEKAMSTLNQFHLRADASSVARALTDRTEEVAAALLGEPSARLLRQAGTVASTLAVLSLVPPAAQNEGSSTTMSAVRAEIFLP